MSSNVTDMEQYLLDGHLADAKTPTDVLWGEEDRMLGMPYARRLETELPAVRLTLLKRCGHAPTRECPMALTIQLKRILSEAPPAIRATELRPQTPMPQVR
jgi:pimeloyl-ACP methyl ester carboxylesterase